MLRDLPCCTLQTLVTFRIRLCGWLGGALRPLGREAAMGVKSGEGEATNLSERLQGALGFLPLQHLLLQPETKLHLSPRGTRKPPGAGRPHPATKAAAASSETRASAHTFHNCLPWRVFAGSGGATWKGSPEVPLLLLGPAPPLGTLGHPFVWLLPQAATKPSSLSPRPASSSPRADCLPEEARKLSKSLGPSPRVLQGCIKWSF